MLMIQRHWAREESMWPRDAVEMQGDVRIGPGEENTREYEVMGTLVCLKQDNALHVSTSDSVALDQSLW